MRLIAIFVVVVTSLAATAAPPSSLVDRIQRLSFDTRGKRLSADERESIERELAAGSDGEALYASRVEAWSDRAFWRRLATRLLGGPPFAADHVFLRLSRGRDADGRVVYFLPPATKPPCRAADAVRVRAWWSKERLPVCPIDYRPEHVFDAVGYCGGQDPLANPLVRRPGCGCGPLLMTCLPPKQDAPELEPQLARDLGDEVIETAADILARDRPFDEILTTSRTWQSGLVELMYLRRELLALLRARPFSPALEHELEARLDQIDVAARARWIERGPPWRGTGLTYSTAVRAAGNETYRGMVLELFGDYLCTEFQSVRVSSDVVLQAVHAHAPTDGAPLDLRSADAIGHSPMRTQVGCKGCHAPMDNAAAMLAGFQTAIRGSMPTGIEGRGQLYLKSPSDLRGQGAGAATLSRLVVAQPELDECVAKRTYQLLLAHELRAADRPLVEQLGRDFAAHGRRYSTLVRALLGSPAYVADVGGAP